MSELHLCWMILTIYTGGVYLALSVTCVMFYSEIPSRKIQDIIRYFIYGGFKVVLGIFLITYLVEIWDNL